MSELYDRIKHALRWMDKPLPGEPIETKPLPEDWLEGGDLGRAEYGPVDRGAFITVEIIASESPRKVVAALEDYGLRLLDMSGWKYIPVYGAAGGFGARHVVYVLSDEGARYVDRINDARWEKKG